jgi:hypothetical protein
MQIADRVLSGDVADYVRFRAACSAWRQCTADPHEDALDRRFHPRRWAMLDDVLGRGARPRYLYSRFRNVATGECIRMTIRGLNGRNGRTFYARLRPQGLLLLLNRKTNDVWVVNPITGARADLPPVTALLSGCPRNLVFPRWQGTPFNAVLTDDSTVVIHFYWQRLLGVERPGDQRWAKVECEHQFSRLVKYEGLVYWVSRNAVMLLETSPGQPPVLVKSRVQFD